MNLIFQNLKISVFLTSLTCLAALSAVAQEKKDEVNPVGQIGFVFEAAFMDPQINKKLIGAKKTCLTAAYTWELGLRLFTREDWQKGDWGKPEALAKFEKAAQKLADDLATKMKPQFIRDDRGVIDYAIVSGKSHFISSVITSKQFLAPFEESLGDKLHVVVVDRHVLYIFPASGGKLGEYGPAIRQIYKSTQKPVSLEIIEVDANGYRVIGEIARPPKTKIE